MKKSIILFFISCIIFSCEPDDICLSSIPDTPKLVIVFYDESSGLRKEVANLKIQGSNNEKIYQFKTKYYNGRISLPPLQTDLDRVKVITKN